MRPLIGRLNKIAAALFFEIINLSVLLLVPKPKKINKSILITRLDHIGDFLLWSGQLEFYRKNWPHGQYKITILANKTWLDLIPEGIFDEIWAVDRNKFIKSLIYRVSYLVKIRKSGFDIVINPLFSRDFYREDSIIRVCDSRVSIGINGDTSNSDQIIKKISNRGYSKLIEISEKNELLINSEFTSSMGISSGIKLANISFKDNAANFNLKDNNYFIIFPGGSWAGKCWPVSKFIDLIARIQNSYNIDGLLCGTSDEDKIADLINKGLKAPLLNLTGKTNLIELCALIKNASFILSNDSGASHIAPIVGTPSVCILGGGHYGRFFPYPEIIEGLMMGVANFKMDCYGCLWKCKYKTKVNDPLPCINDISIDHVFRLIKKVYPPIIYE